MRSHHLNPIHTRRTALWMLGSLCLTGCAGFGPTPHEWARDLPLRFKTPEVRAQLESQGLLKPFTAYWTAYAQRQWALRYKMERFTTEVKEDFYIPYHNGAWIISSFEVVQIHTPDEQARVRVDVNVRFQNPVDPAKTSETLVQDWWIKDNETWMHINTDPMLNGMKPVL